MKLPRSFADRVYRVVQKIPKGETLSYKVVAARAGNPGAYRAVGNILNKNDRADIPCHRVIRSDGNTGGYNRGALRKKRMLLQEKAESQHMSAELSVYRKRRAAVVLAMLNKLCPNARMILEYSNHWELLVAVMLSAQCTDVQVNKVTKQLFKKYPSLDDYILATPSVFEKDIFSTGFYKNKTKNILAAAKVVRDRFGGCLPKTIPEMLVIPGVGRKTANVVLGNAFGIVEGIAVDTHVKRLARLFGLTSAEDPDAIECDLMAVFPKSAWFDITYKIIDYGRRYCTARCRHTDCPISQKIIS